MTQKNLDSLVQQAANCTLCKPYLPHPPRPIFSLGHSKLVLIGQAPGLMAHNTHQAFNDNSGKRLRGWLNMSEEEFYNPSVISIMPMGFCFPGYKNGADAPPRPECAPTWHKTLLEEIQPSTILLVGRYAQQYYLPQFKTLTDALNNANFEEGIIPLPHPSGRNNRWLAKNPWFESQYLPKVVKHLNALKH